MKDDWIAFCAAGAGIVAYAQVAGEANSLLIPEEWPEPTRQERDVYRLPVESVSWLADVIPLTLLLSGLDASKGRSVSRNRGSNWAWFVHSARRISADDLSRLTGKSTSR